MGIKVNPQSKELDPIEEMSEHRQSRPTSPDQLRGDEKFNGPVTERICTDLPCLLGFVVLSFAFVAAIVFSTFYSVILTGDTQRTVHGFDFRAEVCGTGGLTDKRFMYFPDPTDLNFALCVTACPYYYVRDYYCIYASDHTTCLSDYSSYSSVESTVISYYCVPGASPGRDVVMSYLYEPMMILKRAAGDLRMGWSALMIGTILAGVVGMAHLTLFRHQKTVKVLAITSLILSVGLIGFLAYLFYRNYEKGAQTYYAFMALTIALGVGLGLHLFEHRRHMKVSLGLLSLTGKPLHSVRQFFIYPLFQLFCGLGIITVLVSVFMYTLGLASITTVSDTQVPGGQARKLEFALMEQLLFVFVCCMCLLWLVFLSTLYAFVLSTAVATWYFCREKSNLYVRLTQAPVIRAMKTCLRYHLGSVVYHALIRLLLCIPIFLLKPLADYAYSNPSHKRLRTWFPVRIYEGSIKKFAGQAVAFVAVFGEKYGVATDRALELCNRNYLRTGLPLAWGTYLSLCYKLTIALAGTCFAYGFVLFSHELPNGQLSVEITLEPSIGFLSFVVSFFIADVFAGAMETCLRTVLFCAACDEEMFSGEQRFMDKELMDYLDLVAEEQNDLHREYAYNLDSGKKSKIYALKDKEGVVRDEDWEKQILKPPKNPLVKRNYRPIYNAKTPSTIVSMPETDSDQPVTMRANHVYGRADLSTPRILVTPASTAEGGERRTQ